MYALMSRRMRCTPTVKLRSRMRCTMSNPVCAKAGGRAGATWLSLRARRCTQRALGMVHARLPQQAPCTASLLKAHPQIAGRALAAWEPDNNTL